jgi:hypothetical protein
MFPGLGSTSLLDVKYFHENSDRVNNYRSQSDDITQVPGDRAHASFKWRPHFTEKRASICALSSVADRRRETLGGTRRPSEAARLDLDIVMSSFKSNSINSWTFIERFTLVISDVIVIRFDRRMEFSKKMDQ